jgi:hypothetical protein
MVRVPRRPPSQSLPPPTPTVRQPDQTRHRSRSSRLVIDRHTEKAGHKMRKHARIGRSCLRRCRVSGQRRSNRLSHGRPRAPRWPPFAQSKTRKLLDVLDPHSRSSSRTKPSRTWPCASTARRTRSSPSGRRIETPCLARIRPSLPGCSCARPESDELGDRQEISDQGRARGHTNATRQTGVAAARAGLGQRPSLSRRAVSPASSVRVLLRFRSHCSRLQGSAEAHFWGVPRSRLSVAFRGASDSISASASRRRTCASSQLCRCSPDSSSARAGIPSRY